MKLQDSPVTPIVEPIGKGGARTNIQERPALMVSGWLGVLVLLLCAAATFAAINGHVGGWTALPIVAFVVVLSTLLIIPPGQSQVMQFFGSYVGTVRRPGLWLVLPLTVRRTVSVRVRNFETNRLKVNDADGNPIEIAAIVVWQVADTAKAVFAVDDYRDFVSMQSESALRHVASGHPYDEANTYRVPSRPRQRRCLACHRYGYGKAPVLAAEAEEVAA